MGVWTCPNTECIYDDQLQAGQFCPMCGEEAREFSFNEFGGLLRNKEALRKSVEKSKEYERISRRTKFCPKCGSANINFLVFYRPSIWRCLDCGYEGAFIVEDSELAKRIQESHKTLKKKRR